MDTRFDKFLSGLPSDMIDEIRICTPATFDKLFSMTSLGMRSLYYRKRLNEARLSLDHQAQMECLTNLLINHTMLTSHNMWIKYLAAYCEDKNVEIFNRLIAKALLLVLNKNHTPREFNEFKLTLRLFCFNRNCNKNYLYQSILAIVTGRQKIEIPVNDLCNQEQNRIANVYEAQLIIAPFVSFYRTNELTPLNSFIDFFNAQVYLVNNPNCHLLIHALLKLLPADNIFWKKGREKFIWLTDGLPGSISGITNWDARIFHIEVILTLMKHLTDYPRLDPWVEKLSHSRDSKTRERRVFMADHKVARSIHSLQSDDDRLNWLKETLSINAIQLLPFIYQVCVQLSSNSARKRAINSFIALIPERFTQYGQLLFPKEFVELIQILILKLRPDSLIDCNIIHLYTDRLLNAEFKYVLPVISYLPEEVFIPKLEKELEGLQTDDNTHWSFLLWICSQLKSETHIARYLAALQPLVNDILSQQQISERLKYNFSVLSCYARLLSKLPNPYLVNILQEKILSLYQIDFVQATNIWLELAKTILPHVNDDAAIAWSKIIYNDYFKPFLSHMDIAINAGYLSAIECITILLPRLPASIQSNYHDQLMKFVSARSLEINSNAKLAAVTALIKLLPDDLMLQIDFENNNVTRLRPSS